MTVSISHLQAADHAWLKRRYAAYLHEIAPGLRPAPLTKWWREPHRRTIDLNVKARRIGFALLCRPGPGCWEVAEFCILPDHRRLGHGLAAARTVLGSRPGRWRVGVVNQRAAIAFWAQVVTDSDQIRDLRMGRPLSRWQSHSYTFRI